MKVWLNNLKEGDIFYHIILDNVYKCEHLGDAHNMNFKMSRIKYKILDNDNILFNENLLGHIHEAFVNQYVYDNYDEAEEANIDELKKELKSIKESIIEHKRAITNLETREQTLKDKISNYEQKN
jgi:asparagine synthetase A